MVLNNNITYNLDISLLVTVGLIIISFFVILFLKKKGGKTIKIDKIQLGLSGPSIDFKCNKDSRCVAYKIWVECVTRVVGVPIDLRVDIIRNINNSYYDFFKEMRKLLKEIEVVESNMDKQIVTLTVEFLNTVIRPYTTARGVKFNKWYDEASINNKKDPVSIQQMYPEYDKLIIDLLKTNQYIQKYIEEMYNIAF